MNCSLRLKNEKIFLETDISLGRANSSAANIAHILAFLIKATQKEEKTYYNTCIKEGAINTIRQCEDKVQHWHPY